MDRSLVNADRNVTCSTGLHVASLKYARDCYGGQVLVVCKVNPKNVISVPIDYSGMKMRTCEYTVLEVLEDVSKPLVAPVYTPGVDTQVAAQKPRCCGEGACCSSAPNNYYDSLKAGGGKVKRITDDNHLHQQRDAKGHFIKKPRW